jgi:hypothetical protein
MFLRYSPKFEVSPRPHIHGAGVARSVWPRVARNFLFSGAARPALRPQCVTEALKMIMKTQTESFIQLLCDSARTAEVDYERPAHFRNEGDSVRNLAIRVEERPIEIAFATSAPTFCDPWFHVIMKN